MKVDGSSQDTTGASNGGAFCSSTAWNGANVTNKDNLNNKTTIGSEKTSAVGIAMAYGESLGATGRLMTYEEAEILETENSAILYGKYEGNMCLSYWLGSAADDYDVWIAYGLDSYLIAYPFDGSYSGYAVRPVLEVLISSIN